MTNDIEEGFERVFRERAAARRRALQEKLERQSRAQTFRNAFREHVRTVIGPTLEFLQELLEKNGIAAEIQETGSADEREELEPSIGLRANAEDRRPTPYLADAIVQLTYSCSADKRVVAVSGSCAIKGRGTNRSSSDVSLHELTEEAVQRHFLALMHGQPLR
ncbi:MAG TPA: hypothetical protein VMG11_13535 [Steroidobacteraceae bacterium]|nr:hypothetical protein [Steroidobacteraceae bacterium]